MNAKQFLETYGWTRAEKVAIAAGTNRAYFSHIARGHRNASLDLAERLVDASDGELDLLSLMKAKRTRDGAAA